MRMSQGHYPCPEQAHQSPTHAPQTEQQERDHQAPSRQDRPVYHKVAWIAGDEAHQEGNDESLFEMCLVKQAHFKR